MSKFVYNPIGMYVPPLKLPIVVKIHVYEIKKNEWNCEGQGFYIFSRVSSSNDKY